MEKAVQAERIQLPPKFKRVQNGQRELKRHSPEEILLVLVLLTARKAVDKLNHGNSYEVHDVKHHSYRPRPVRLLLVDGEAAPLRMMRINLMLRFVVVVVIFAIDQELFQVDLFKLRNVE